MQSGFLTVLLALSAIGAGNSPASWSADGAWVAFTTLSTPNARTLPEPGWIFQGSNYAGIEVSSVDNAVPPADSPDVTSRLHLASTTDARSIVLEETSGRLSAPGWRPDGLALVVGRVVRTVGGGEQFDLLIYDSVGKGRVIYSQSCREDCSTELIHRYGLHAPAWSPDGRYVAVPIPIPKPSIRIIRADNGQVLRQEDDAYWPVWSPDGVRLAFCRGPNGANLKVVDATFGPARDLPALGKTFQPPRWTNDSRSLLTVNLRTIPGGMGTSSTVEISRINIETGATAISNQLHSNALELGAAIRNVSYAYSKSGDDLFYSLDIEREPPVIVVYRPLVSETIDRISPVDPLLKTTILGISPTSNQMAVRIGTNPSGNVVGLYEAGSSTMSPIVSNDDARIEWVKLLVHTARSVLRSALPSATPDGKPIRRATIIPIPGELVWNNENSYKLRRLAKLGLPLCKRPDDPALPAADPKLTEFLDESRFFFQILVEDFAGALAAIETVENKQSDPDRRLRLLSLRAQLYLAVGECDRARDASAFLKTLSRKAPRTIEETPNGFVLHDSEKSLPSWSDYLEDRIDEAIKKRQADADLERRTLGNTNPDLPDAPTLPPFPFQNQDRADFGPLMPRPPARPPGNAEADDEPLTNRRFRRDGR